MHATSQMHHTLRTFSKALSRLKNPSLPSESNRRAFLIKNFTMYCAYESTASFSSKPQGPGNLSWTGIIPAPQPIAFDTEETIIFFWLDLFTFLSQQQFYSLCIFLWDSVHLTVIRIYVQLF